MKRRIKIVIGCLSIFLLGVGFGYLLNCPRGSASPGVMPPSPDGRFSASAFPWTETRGIGHSHDRTYSEFKITADVTNIVRKVIIEDSAQIPPIDWYDGEGHVVWSTNSSVVTFSYDGPQTSFQMTLKIQP